jgi:glyoxalase superfamily protein
MAGESSFRLKTVVFDARDHRGLARFYVGLTGGTEHYADDEWVTTFTGDGWRLGFQAAPDHLPPRWPDPNQPQQMHLDFLVADLTAATATAERLGARRIGAGETWNVLADPAGHPFCLCATEQTAPISTFAVHVDCPAGEQLAAFYAALLEYPVKSSRVDTIAWIGGAEPAPMGDLLFQTVAGYQPPRWPDPAHPQQLHLDISVTDADAAETRALELGASRLPGEGENWRVYADPDGHPFCLIEDH